MKKRNRIFSLGLLALVLALATTSLVSGTLAKYVTTANATGTVTVAKWSVKLGSSETTTTTPTTAIALVNTIEANDDVVADKVAPGTKGSFSLYYDTSGTEVDHSITITLSKAGAMYEGIKFYKTESDRNAGTNALDLSNAVSLDPINVLVNSSPVFTGSVSIYWAWDFHVDAATDVTDTNAGSNATSYTLNATATVTQLDNDVFNP